MSPSVNLTPRPRVDNIMGQTHSNLRNSQKRKEKKKDGLTHPEKTPPRRTKKTLRQIFHQNSGEPSSSPSLTLLGITASRLVLAERGKERATMGVDGQGQEAEICYLSIGLGSVRESRIDRPRRVIISSRGPRHRTASMMRMGRIISIIMQTRPATLDKRPRLTPPEATLQAGIKRSKRKKY